MQHPYLLLLFAALVWGGNAVVSRLAVGEIAPMTLVLLRWTAALAVLLPVALPAVKKDWAIIRTHWPLLAAYGCCGFAGFNLLYYAAGHSTTAVNIALLQASIPIMILLINGLVFKQGFHLWQMIGLLMALVGVLLIISAGNITTLLDLTLNRGDVMMLIASLMYALYSIGLRYHPDISWVSFIFVLAIAAWLTALPFAVYENLTQAHTFNWSLKSLFLIIYISIFASILAQIAYAKGLKQVGASRGGFALNLVPIFGALLAVAILGERLQFYHLAALALVLGGIALSEKSST